MRRHTHPVKKLLYDGNSRQLRRLTQFSSQLTELTALVRSALPTPLQGHCQVVNIRGKSLVLRTESSAWASQLRFYLPAMLSTLTHHRCNYIKEICIRITPVSAPNRPDTRRTVDISSRSATLITSLANSTPHDRLKQSLLRLARHRPRDFRR